MQASLTALEQIAHIRNNYLKKYCHEMTGTVADWKMVNYVNDARLTTLNLVELSGLDKSTVSRQLNMLSSIIFCKNKVMKSTNVKVLLRLPIKAIP